MDGASYDLASVKPNDAITDGKTVIFDAGEKTYLMVVSVIKLEAMSYELRTVYDVTNVYDEHDASLNNGALVGALLRRRYFRTAAHFPYWDFCAR